MTDEVQLKDCGLQSKKYLLSGQVNKKLRLFPHNLSQRIQRIQSIMSSIQPKCMRQIGKNNPHPRDKWAVSDRATKIIKISNKFK